MAEAVIDFQGVDIFSLGSDFKAQNGTRKTNFDTTQSTNTLGEVHKRKRFNKRYEYTCEYQYVGDNLETDSWMAGSPLANAMTNGDPDAGSDDVSAKVLVDTVNIRMAESEPVTISISGHNHADNPHLTAVGSGSGASGSATEGDVDTFGGFDLALSTLVGTDIDSFYCPPQAPYSNAQTANSEQVEISLNYQTDHKDIENAAGKHFAGRSYNGRCDITSTFAGMPPSPLTFKTGVDEASGFAPLVLDIEERNDNQDFDSVTVNASLTLNRTTSL